MFPAGVKIEAEFPTANPGPRKAARTHAILALTRARRGGTRAQVVAAGTYSVCSGLARPFPLFAVKRQVRFWPSMCENEYRPAPPKSQRVRTAQDRRSLPRQGSEDHRNCSSRAFSHRLGRDCEFAR